MSKEQDAAIVDFDPVLLKLLNESSLVSRTDAQGNITHVNDEFCRVSGYTREELVGQNHRILKTDLNPKDVWLRMYRTTAKNKDLFEHLIYNRAKDGKVYIVYSFFRAVFNDEGKLTGYASVRQDLTEHIARKEALQEMSAELSGYRVDLETANLELGKALADAEAAKDEAEASNANAIEAKMEAERARVTAENAAAEARRQLGLEQKRRQGEMLAYGAKVILFLIAGINIMAFAAWVISAFSPGPDEVMASHFGQIMSSTLIGALTIIGSIYGIKQMRKEDEEGKKETTASASAFYDDPPAV